MKYFCLKSQQKSGEIYISPLFCYYLFVNEHYQFCAKITTDPAHNNTTKDISRPMHIQI